MALAIPVDESRIMPAAGVQGSIASGDPDATGEDDPGVIPALLAAAGIPPETALLAVRRVCRIWLEPGVPGAVAVAFQAEFARGLAGTLGLAFPPSETVGDPAEADLIIYRDDSPRPALTTLPDIAASFLGITPPPAPGPPASATSGGAPSGRAPQALPSGGSGGLAADPDPALRVDFPANDDRAYRSPLLVALAVTTVLGLLGCGVVRRWLPQPYTSMATGCSSPLRVKSR
jgi:hypothetical protein